MADQSASSTNTTALNEPPAPGPAGEQWLEATLEQVFITPRVVDEQAYDALSGKLRSLVRDAGTQSRALITTTGEVKLLGDQLREATHELQQRVETAVRVIPTLDQRVARAEQLLELTGKELASKVAEARDISTKGVTIDRERIAAQLRAETSALVEVIVREQVSTLRERMEGAVLEAQAQADRRVAVVMERLRATQEALDAALERSEGQARTLVQSLDVALSQRVNAANEVVAAAPAPAPMPQPEGVIDKAVEITAALEQLVARAEAAHAATDASVRQAGLHLGAALSEADRRVEAIEVQALNRIAELREKAIEVVEITSQTRVEEVLATAKDTFDAASQSAATCAELKELLAQAANLGGIGQLLGTASAEIDVLAGRLSQLRADYQVLESIDEAGLDAKVRQMGAWLSQLLTQGDQIGRGLDRLVKQATPLIDRLNQHSGPAAS